MSGKCGTDTRLLSRVQKVVSVGSCIALLSEQERVVMVHHFPPNGTAAHGYGGEAGW
jgi:hypothetical protein